MSLEIELMSLRQQMEREPDLKKEIEEILLGENAVKHFCEKCAGLGYSHITPYELLTAGEEFCAAMLRSVNGGGVEAPDDWDDCFDIF